MFTAALSIITQKNGSNKYGPQEDHMNKQTVIHQYDGVLFSIEMKAIKT